MLNEFQSIQELENLNVSLYKSKPSKLVDISKELLKFGKYERAIELLEFAINFVIEINNEDPEALECANYYYYYATAIIIKLMNSDDELFYVDNKINPCLNKVVMTNKEIIKEVFNETYDKTGNYLSNKIINSNKDEKQNIIQNNNSDDIIVVNSETNNVVDNKSLLSPLKSKNNFDCDKENNIARNNVNSKDNDNSNKENDKNTNNIDSEVTLKYNSKKLDDDIQKPNNIPSISNNNSDKISFNKQIEKIKELVEINDRINKDSNSNNDYNQFPNNDKDKLQGIQNHDIINNLDEEDIDEESLEEEASDEKIAYSTLIKANKIFNNYLTSKDNRLHHKKFSNLNDYLLFCKNNHEIYNYSEVISIFEFKAKIWVSLGDLEKYKSDFPKAVEQYLKGLNIRRCIYEWDSREVAEIYFLLGGTYDFDIKKSLTCYYKAKMIIESNLCKKLEQNKTKNKDDNPQLYNMNNEITNNIDNSYTNTELNFITIGNTETNTETNTDIDTNIKLINLRNIDNTFFDKSDINKNEIYFNKNLTSITNEDTDEIKELKEILSELYDKVITISYYN